MCIRDSDIPTLTILEDYLDSFAGIVIAVSHDRYFLDNLADRIFEFDREGNLTQYEGGYTEMCIRDRVFCSVPISHLLFVRHWEV